MTTTPTIHDDHKGRITIMCGPVEVRAWHYFTPEQQLDATLYASLYHAGFIAGQGFPREDAQSTPPLTPSHYSDVENTRPEPTSTATLDRGPWPITEG